MNEHQLQQQFEAEEGIKWNPYSITVRDWLIKRSVKMEKKNKQILEGIEDIMIDLDSGILNIVCVSTMMSKLERITND